MYLGRQFGACRVVGGPDEPARARHICEIWDVCLRAVSATRRSWLHAKTLCMFLSCFALSKRFTCTCIIPICAVTPLKISFTPPSGARSPALPLSRNTKEIDFSPFAPPTLKVAGDHPQSWGRVLPSALGPVIKSIHTTAPIYSQLFLESSKHGLSRVCRARS